MAPKTQKLGSITANSSEANKKKGGSLLSKLSRRKSTQAKRNGSYLSQEGSTDTGSHLGLGGDKDRNKDREERDRNRDREERDRNRESRRERSGSVHHERNGSMKSNSQSMSVHHNAPSHHRSPSSNNREGNIPKNIVALPSDMPYHDDVDNLITNYHPPHHSSSGSVASDYSKFDMNQPSNPRRSMLSDSTDPRTNLSSGRTHNLKGSVIGAPSHHRGANDRYHKTDEVGGGIFDDGYLGSVRKAPSSSSQPTLQDRRRLSCGDSMERMILEEDEKMTSNGQFQRASSVGSNMRSGSGGGVNYGSAVGAQPRSRNSSIQYTTKESPNRRDSSNGSSNGGRCRSRKSSLCSTDEELPRISTSKQSTRSSMVDYSNSHGVYQEFSQPQSQPLGIPSFPKHIPDTDDEQTMATMATKLQALKPDQMAKAKDMTVPQGNVTIVYTDVQGSTSMWEACPTAMKEATDIHDMIMRQCYTDHSGYEITTEGDAFNLAFQHPMDALAFALQAQLKLYKADWPKGILNHPDGKDEPALKFRGFRVRFGMHHGPTTTRIHESTGRTVYSGEGVKIAKAVEGLCHGGQILATAETWKAVSGMAERYLGRPQIIDCGEHLLFETKTPSVSSSGFTTKRFCKRIMQLVPSELSFDFFSARGRKDIEDGEGGFEIKDASSVCGRLFPPLISKRQLTTSFLNAPYANGRVTICFVYTVGLDDSNPSARSPNLQVLAKYLRKKLLVLNPPGYECQEDDGHWMLAFDKMASAVSFGIALTSSINDVSGLVGSVDRTCMFKVGIISGPFTSMGPHKTTGMADYFGPIVNRAARVASNCDPGQVCVGMPLANGDAAVAPDFGSDIDVRLLEIKKLKGLTIDVAIFACNKK